MSRRASGLKAWFLQRVSALYLILFTLYFLQHMIFCPPADYPAWQAWVSGPLVEFALLLFFASLLLHAWVGIRDVLIDYVHPTAARVTILSVIGFVLVGCGLWVLRIIFLTHLA